MISWNDLWICRWTLNDLFGPYAPFKAGLLQRKLVICFPVKIQHFSRKSVSRVWFAVEWRCLEDKVVWFELLHSLHVRISTGWPFFVLMWFCVFSLFGKASVTLPWFWSSSGTSSCTNPWRPFALQSHWTLNQATWQQEWTRFLISSLKFQRDSKHNKNIFIATEC